VHVPPHFRPSDDRLAWRVIDEHGFAPVVTALPGAAPRASHLPLLGRPGEGERGRLIGHLAAANPQREDLAAGLPVLAVFQGPSAFVSASWYREEPSVPTWDHVTVHVRGRPRVLPGHEATLEVLRATVEHFERQAGSAWRLDTGSDYVRDLARGVVAFVVEVEEVEAIAKLSQNVAPHLRARVREGLAAAGRHDVVAAMDGEVG
jgi:transcriptional regulator